MTRSEESLFFATCYGTSGLRCILGLLEGHSKSCSSLCAAAG